MDLEKLDLPLNSAKQRRPQTGELGLLDYFKLVVMAKLLRKSLAATLQTAVYTYIQRNWEDAEKRLQTEAKARGVEPESLFNQLASGEDLEDG